jgi:hypothetical protein
MALSPESVATMELAVGSAAAYRWIAELQEQESKGSVIFCICIHVALFSYQPLFSRFKLNKDVKKLNT